jgi:hypothetical protein
MREIPIHLVVEDLLSEAVLRKLLAYSKKQFFVGTCYCQGGFGYIKNKIMGFNLAAKGTPFLVLTDLDQAACPPELIDQWLTTPKHPNLIFRIAVREVEAWLLADRKGFARFSRIPEKRIPANSEGIPNPKEQLIELVKHSPLADLRTDIVPRQGTTAKIGPNYNGRLIEFVNSKWDIEMAQKNSTSLLKAVKALDDFEPKWSKEN